MHTRFILIEPSHAGNVGATARAMKVMGFDDLVLVRPRWANVLRREETIQRASGALDVLNRCKVVDTLDEAVQGMQHLCATAMTPRDFGAASHAPRERLAWLAKQAHGANDLLQKNEHQSLISRWQSAEKASEICPAEVARLESVAMLFGTERYGMSNDDVYRCHSVITIPTNVQFGSLNLAAAVQVMAYEWRLALGGFDAAESENAVPNPAESTRMPPKLADARAVQGLLQHLAQALAHVGYFDPAAPKKLLPRLNQLFNRAALRDEEVHILRGVAKAVLATPRPPLNPKDH